MSEPEPDATNKRASTPDLNAGFRASLYRFFSRRVRGSSEIEDMVQEVFARLLKRGGVESMDHVAGYVFQTARSVLTDYNRRNRSRYAQFHTEFDPNTHGGVEFSPEQAFVDRETLERATALLLELPERTRVVFTLRRLEGMRYLDIAARLGLTVSAIEKHMQKAVLHLTTGLRNP